MNKKIEEVLEILKTLEISDHKGQLLEEYTVRENEKEQTIKIYKKIPLEDENKIEGTDCILYFSGKIDEQTDMFCTTGGLSYIDIQQIEENKYRVKKREEEKIIDTAQQVIELKDVEKWTQQIEPQVVKEVSNEIIQEANRNKSRAEKVKMRA